MTTMTAPDIPAQLEAAQRNARELRAEYDTAEGELAQAVEALDYERANTLKQRADELRPALLLSENQVRALEATAQALADHETQLHAAEREKERQARCDEIVAEATAAEQAALTEADRLLSEARAGLKAIAGTLRAAQAAEQAAGHHRQTAHQAQVEAGRQEWTRFALAMPNRVESAIDESPVFPAILRTTF